MKGKELPEGKRGSLLQKVRKMQVKFQTSKGNSTFLKKKMYLSFPQTLMYLLHEQYWGILGLSKKKSSALGNCITNQEPRKPHERSVWIYGKEISGAESCILALKLDSSVFSGNS